MNKQIVVITGSPRLRGNSNALAEAFIRRAGCYGYKVLRFDAANMTLSGCNACKCCYTAGRACISDDDFNLIASRIETADAVVFALPVYWFSFPAQIKCVIDKFHAFLAGGRDVAGKRFCFMTCCAEGDDEVLCGVVRPLELMARLLGWRMVGDVAVSGVTDAGDVLAADATRRAVLLAERLHRDFECGTATTER